jgi:hypothetical protein
VIGVALAYLGFRIPGLAGGPTPPVLAAVRGEIMRLSILLLALALPGCAAQGLPAAHISTPA